MANGPPTLMEQHVRTNKDGKTKAPSQVQEGRKMQDGRKRDRRKMEYGQQKRKLRPPLIQEKHGTVMIWLAA